MFRYASSDRPYVQRQPPKSWPTARNGAEVRLGKRILECGLDCFPDGLLGSLVGGGKGKTLATVAGAAAGGYAGKQVQEDMQQKAS